MNISASKLVSSNCLFVALFLYLCSTVTIQEQSSPIFTQVVCPVSIMFVYPTQAIEINFPQATLQILSLRPLVPLEYIWYKET